MSNYYLKNAKRKPMTTWKPHVVLKPVKKWYLLHDLESLEKRLRAGTLKRPLKGRDRELVLDGWRLVPDLMTAAFTAEELYEDLYDEFTIRYAGLVRSGGSGSITQAFLLVMLRIEALLKGEHEDKENTTATL
jgi:hypothetical protein